MLKYLDFRLRLLTSGASVSHYYNRPYMVHSLNWFEVKGFENMHATIIDLFTVCVAL